MIVIADDITGAAEIAGIAHSHGNQVRLICSNSVDDSGAADDDSVAANNILVIATDTRSMTEAEAIAETCRVASFLKAISSHRHILFFKKTDSALRGHVVAELATLMEAIGCRRTVYLPANPSKGRIIRAGTYFIKGVPLHETDFNFDPEFPAKTAVLRERFPDAEEKGIIMPDAENEEALHSAIQEYNDGQTLFAGAADLFTALLSLTSQENKLHHGACQSSNSQGAKTAVPPQASTLILCGSTQSKPLGLGIPVCEMPQAVYDGKKGADEWYAALKVHPNLLTALILTIPYHYRNGKEVAVYLRTVMAGMASHLVARRVPDHLIIEGGATAWATLQELGWTQFEVVQQTAPGVVLMRAKCGTFVTLKPGSYPWGNMFR